MTGIDAHDAIGTGAIGTGGPEYVEVPAVVVSGVLTSGFLFEIGDDPIRLSTVPCAWNEIDMNEYAGDIISGSFSGVTMRVDLTSRLYAPSEITFSIENTDGRYSVTDIKGEYVVVRMLVNSAWDDGLLANTGVRSWKFIITHAQSYYGKIVVKAVDLLQKYMTGYYPTTPLIQSVFPGDMKCADDMACVPKIFNSAYIPIAPGAYNAGGGMDWYYIIASGSYNAANYVFDTIYAPPERNTASWTDVGYDFNGITVVGSDGKNYAGMQFLIHESGTVNGIWPDGENGVLSPWLSYGQANQPYVGAGPAEILYYVLVDAGISATIINWGTSWTDIDTAIDGLTTASIELNFGLFRKEPFENFLSEYLRCFDLYMSFGEKIDVHLFSATSIETFTTADIITETYSADFHDPEDVDSGTVAFVRYDDDPDYKMGGQILVPLYTGGPTDKPSGDVFNFRFRFDDTDLPATFGQLFFQKTYDIKHPASFAISAGDASTFETIRPGQVITIPGSSAYGDEQKIVITEISFTPDLELRISGNVYNHLEDITTLTSPVTYTPGVVTGAYEISSYNVEKVNSATGAIILDGDDVHIVGRIAADSHDAFQVTMSASMSAIAENTDTDIAFNTETNDHTGAFATGTYTYTAKGDGYRQFNVNVRFNGLNTDAEYVLLSLYTSNQTFTIPKNVKDLVAGTDPVICFSQLAWMENNDTAKVTVKFTGGSGTMGIDKDYSFFSGFYVFK